MPNMPDHEQRLHDVRAGDVARAEQPQRHERFGDPRLARDERREQRERDAAEHERRGRVQPCSPTSRIV